MGVQEHFYELVSGQMTGTAARLLRTGLQFLEVPYCSAVTLRNVLYDCRILSPHRFSLPIISVGNLTLGGTGKSPMTAWLCRFFLEQKLRPGIISRGYKKSTNEGNDEFKEMSLLFPTVPHIQHRQRAEAVEQLLHHEHVDLIILDDAFQHRQVARNIDIVLLDATAPFGYGHVFPRGTLREPLSGLHRADIVLLTRSDLISESDRQIIHQKALSLNPNIIWGETIHFPSSLVALDGFQEEPLDALEGQSALVFCGIGNPAAFRKTLEQCGVHIVKLIPFPDHYGYTQRDADNLKQTAKELGIDLILCTMKDLVKMNCSQWSGLPLKGVAIDLRFTQGEPAVCERLNDQIPPLLLGEGTFLPRGSHPPI